MDWSVLFLSGETNFFKVNNNCLSPLVNNPVTSMNAHGHKRNHPAGFDCTQKYVEIFLQSPHQLLTLYPCLLYHEYASQELHITEDQLIDQQKNHEVKLFQLEDFCKLFNYLSDLQSNIIYVDHNLPAYNIEIRTLDKMFREPRRAETSVDLENKIQSVYFSKSMQQWANLGLTDIWDLRERLALATRPLSPIVKPNLDLSRPHCFIESQEWLTNGTTTIKRIMDFCNLAIDNHRWNDWVTVYRNWQLIHHRGLNFSHQLTHIIDAIINNWYYEIDLTFNQEVVVQHCLIYEHNLNLKTWQLEKFPNNTQELHKLLEDNIHPL